MGISEVDALALIFGGAVLVHRFFTETFTTIMQVVLLLLGFIMLAVGVLDIVIDSL
jgi:hypothetical protein